MKLVFIGASGFGLRCLELVCKMPGLCVAGVVTAPEVFSISYRPAGVKNVLHADFDDFARSRCIPVALLRHGMNDPILLETVRNWQPEAFIVVGWYHMVTKRWRDLAPAYGLHASLLPDYSGGAPLVWAMINGETKTGITLFQMDAGVDSGPIAGQAKESIHEDDTIATLYARIEQRGLDLVHEALPQLAKGTMKLQPQNENKRRIFPQRGPEDGVIDWHWSAKGIYDFVRAQTKPYPGAFTTWKGRHIKIWSSRLVRDEHEQGLSVGQVLIHTDSALVKTGSGILEIIEASYEHKDITGAEVARIVGMGTILGT